MKILHYPHPALRHASRPLTSIDDKVRAQARDMLDLMINAKGLGLASNQVGLPYQILVVNPDIEPDHPITDTVFINPVIYERKGAQEGEEGCLSFPELYGPVRRAKTIKARAYNLKGEMFEVSWSDLKARVLQHEVDHLHGILFIDKMGRIARWKERARIEEFERRFRRAQEKGDIPPEAQIEKELQELAALA
jgi:peptide deformylase